MRTSPTSLGIQLAGMPDGQFSLNAWKIPFADNLSCLDFVVHFFKRVS